MFVILAASAGGAYLYVQRSGVQSEVAELNRQVVLARLDAEALRTENGTRAAELEEKKGELSRKEAQLKQQGERSMPQGLPSRQQALDLSSQLVGHATERGLQLQSFQTSQGAIKAGGTEFPSVSYTVIAKGEADSLLGMLGIIGGIATARIEKLEFARDSEDAGSWTMDLDLAVIYAGEGGEGIQ